MVELRHGASLTSGPWDAFLSPPQMAETAKVLWADPAIQQVWSQRSQLQVQVNETVANFIERIDELATDDYIPTEVSQDACGPSWCLPALAALPSAEASLPVASLLASCHSSAGRYLALPQPDYGHHVSGLHH